MKNKIFAFAVSLLMVVMSANSSAFETVDVETSDEISAAELFSEENDENAALTEEIKPGINLITGTSEPETFDMGKPDCIVKADDSEPELTMDGTNSVLFVTNDSNPGYHDNIVLWSGSPIDRPVYVSLKVKSTVTLTGQYGALLFKCSGDWQVSGTNNGTADGWTTYTALYNPDTDLKPTTEVRIHSSHSAAPYTDYFDDVAVIPCYKVTYKNADGSVYKETYVKPGASFKLPTKSELGTEFYPKYTDADGSEYLAGFEYPLNYEDIELTVGKTNLIVYEGFDTIPENTDAAGEGEDFSYAPSNDGFGNVRIVQGDDCAAGKLYVTSVKESDGNMAAQFTGSNGNWGALGFKLEHLDFSQPGTYHVDFDIKVSSTDSKVQRVWTQALNSTAPQFESFNSVRSDVWQKLGWTVDVVKNGEKYVYTVSNSAGLVNSITKDAPYSDAVWQFYFPAVSGQVLVYIDNISVTYDEPKNVKTVFIENGKNLFEENVACNDGVYTLPTAAELGLDYNPVFVIDGAEYLPGEIYVVADGTDEINFSVEKTNIVLRESFDKRYITFADNGDISDFSYKAAGFDGKITGGDFTYQKSYAIKTVSGRNALEAASIEAGQYHTLGFYKLSLTKKPGTYTFKVVFKESDGFSGGLVLNDKNGGYNVSCGMTDYPGADSDGFKTARFDIELYTGTDGELWVRYITDVYNKTVEEKKFTDAMLTDMMFYVATSSVYGTLWIDELSVEYTSSAAYAPHWYKDATQAKDVTEIRVQKDGNGAVVDGKSGLRFKGYIEHAYKNDAKLKEYGFIVARTEVLGENALTHEFKLPESSELKNAYISHANYISGTDTDYMLYTDTDLAADVFSCVLVNIPVERYNDNFTVRAWSLVDSEYVYGTPMNVSILEILEGLEGESKDTAKPLLDKYNEWKNSQTEG